MIGNGVHATRLAHYATRITHLSRRSLGEGGSRITFHRHQFTTTFSAFGLTTNLAGV